MRLEAGFGDHTDIQQVTYWADIAIEIPSAFPSETTDDQLREIATVLANTEIIKNSCHMTSAAHVTSVRLTNLTRDLTL